MTSSGDQTPALPPHKGRQLRFFSLGPRSAIRRVFAGSRGSRPPSFFSSVIPASAMTIALFTFYFAADAPRIERALNIDLAAYTGKNFGDRDPLETLTASTIPIVAAASDPIAFGLVGRREQELHAQADPEARQPVFQGTPEALVEAEGLRASLAP